MPSHEPTRTSPSTTRLVNPIRAIPHRTTSQLSTVSVSVESPSRNLHKTSVSPVGQDKLSSPNNVQNASASAGSSRNSSLNTHHDVSPRGSKTGSSSTSSRKGKEKVLEDVGSTLDEVEGGEMMTTSDDAAKGLRELVRKSTVSEDLRKRRPSADLVELEEPIGERILRGFFFG